MIDVDRLLTELGIEHRNAGPKNFKAMCINPEHHETKPSMNIHRESGVVHCFGCDLTGNVFTLLGYKGITGSDAVSFLMKFAMGGQTEDELRKSLEEFLKARGEIRENAERTIKYSDIELPVHRMIEENFYLQGRGIDRDEMVRWKMAVITHGRSLGWILIPIYQDNVLRNYFMRSTLGSGKLYGPYPREDILAGIDLAADYSQPICITEGIFDTVFVQKTGMQSVACLSNKLLPKQIERLKKYLKVIIVPDNDEMGFKLVESAGPLIYSTELYVCKLPEGKKDAASCSVDDITQSMQSLIPWNEFVIKRMFSRKIS
jgi:DNA primase